MLRSAGGSERARPFFVWLPTQGFLEMRLLVQIDLTDADIARFEAYETAVLALLPDHGGMLELRVRGTDRPIETHVLSFPSDQAFDDFVHDPRRIALAQDWVDCGARADRWGVVEVN